ncbi:MarR family transcriptional regulator [Rhodobacter sp. NTK016B]|uniref:MarR family winged helix-turn-helix transcriptional regulator n=1 Tax=Rhodobacter sp. NTK016B TaxID=2759676 RepID=UPI001A8E3AEE|nr:MarR family transcriptional regulator [Rhodobacter sp. NTK016B]MBN8291312.1 MarR family transcriptional regulator [Rhodobacter sp. NTK016B]
MRHRPTLGALVWTLSTRWRRMTDRALADLGLTHAQFAALDVVGQSRRDLLPERMDMADQTDLRSPVDRPLLQSDLAAALAVTPIFASKLARALERDGLIARGAVSGDARARSLSLTAQGERVLTQARARVRTLETRLVEPLGNGETQAGQAMRILLRSLIAHEAGARG